MLDMHDSSMTDLYFGGDVDMAGEEWTRNADTEMSDSEHLDSAKEITMELPEHTGDIYVEFAVDEASPARSTDLSITNPQLAQWQSNDIPPTRLDPGQQQSDLLLDTATSEPIWQSTTFAPPRPADEQTGEPTIVETFTSEGMDKIQGFHSDYTTNEASEVVEAAFGEDDGLGDDHQHQEEDAEGEGEKQKNPSTVELEAIPEKLEVVKSTTGSPYFDGNSNDEERERGGNEPTYVSQPTTWISENDEQSRSNHDRHNPSTDDADDDDATQAAVGQYSEFYPDVEAPPCIHVKFPTTDLEFFLFKGPTIRAEDYDENDLRDESKNTEPLIIFQNQPDLYRNPLAELLSALRADADLSEHIGDAELLICCEDLNLTIGEDNRYVHDVSAADLDILQSGEHNDGPLQLTLALNHDRFITRYRAMMDKVHRDVAASDVEDALNDFVPSLSLDDKTQNISQLTPKKFLPGGEELVDLHDTSETNAVEQLEDDKSGRGDFKPGTGSSTPATPSSKLQDSGQNLDAHTYKEESEDDKETYEEEDQEEEFSNRAEEQESSTRSDAVTKDPGQVIYSEEREQRNEDWVHEELHTVVDEEPDNEINGADASEWKTSSTISTKRSFERIEDSNRVAAVEDEDDDAHDLKRLRSM